MKCKLVRLVVAVLVFLHCTTYVFALVPVYRPKPATGIYTGYAEIDNPSAPTYGQVKIEYNYWLDPEGSGYWIYSYKIYNNDVANYHFSWNTGTAPNYNLNQSLTAYNTINKFSINLDPDGNGKGPDDLHVLDTLAKASTGGGPWGHSADLFNKGVDWTVSMGTNTPKPIEPARRRWEKISGNNYGWVNYYAGDTSTGDGPGTQYFQIASRWLPGLCKASVVAGTTATAYSNSLAVDGIYGPVVAPEPATCLILGFGAISLLSYRRRTNCRH